MFNYVVDTVTHEEVASLTERLGKGAAECAILIYLPNNYTVQCPAAGSARDFYMGSYQHCQLIIPGFSADRHNLLRIIQPFRILVHRSDRISPLGQCTRYIQ